MILSHRAVAGAFLAIALASADAHADAARFESGEVKLQLVAETPRADGTIRAALRITLAPGWKTYWRDPGEAGIPPSFDFAGSRNAGPARVGFPAPHRFSDGYGMSNGYSGDMAVTFVMPQTAPGEPTDIRLKILLGVCEKICVPVQAELALGVPARVMSPADGASAASPAVAEAFAALPPASEPGTGIVGARLTADGTHILVSTAAPLDPATSDLFVAGPRGWSFGPPEDRAPEGAGTRISLPVLSRPRQLPAQGLAVDAVLTQGSASTEVRGLDVAAPPDGSTPLP